MRRRNDTDIRYYVTPCGGMSRIGRELDGVLVGFFRPAVCARCTKILRAMYGGESRCLRFLILPSGVFRLYALVVGSDACCVSQGEVSDV